MRTLVGCLGISAAVLFGGSLALFSMLDPEFDPFRDHVSYLGSEEARFPVVWSLVGFAAVGVLLAAFGLTYGLFLKSYLCSILLTLFGFGFSLIAIPFDFNDEAGFYSKAHMLAVCLGYAAWLLGLARVGSLGRAHAVHAWISNVTATLIVVTIVGHIGRFWYGPVTNTLLLAITFLWCFVTAVVTMWKLDEKPFGTQLK